ncbi:MAG: ATP-binding cassette domain-containing protein, partial [Chlorobi bacterium]|nr:ATP-binding cassette domain-containing protein [Chlorobiota bacterium]
MTVSVNNITKYYGSAAAVKDVSFEVNTGEVVGFLGPNGAGKTTTMKIITCFMPPTSGIVTVNGYSIFDNPREVRSKIGYLPESNPLYPDMSVVEFLDYSGRMQGMKSNSLVARIDEMIDMTGLGNMRHKDIFELSKGYKQRVGLAQAMLHDPEVLILDEPTSGLDPNQIIEIRKLIRKMGENKTVILSTHILTEVQAVCDRVLIINKGEIVADGNIDQLRDDFAGAETVNLEIKANTNISTDEIAGQ